MRFRVLAVMYVLALVGCGSKQAPMRVWGEVTFDGTPIQDGKIVFVPADGSPGPTVGGDINGGRYEVPAKTGPWAGSIYKVEITALAKNGTKLPNPSDPSGPPVELADNFIPAKFNYQTELRADISTDSAKNEINFHLLRESKP